MKTSSKVLIGLLATIFLSMSAIFVDVRVFGVHRSKYPIVKHQETYPLGQFKHILVSDQRKTRISPSISIVSSDKNYITIEHYADTMVYGFEHQIVNDTLLIYSIVDKPFLHSFKLHVNSTIQSISTEGANLQLNGIRQDSIRLYLNRGEINSWRGNESTLSKFNKATVSQLNSKVNFHNTIFDTLDLSMEKSSAGFDEDIDFVKASLKNNSRLDLKNAIQLTLEKDGDSRIYMR